MRFSWQRLLGWFILIPFFLLSVYPYAGAEEEGDKEKTEEVAAEEKGGKGFYDEYIKAADYALSTGFMKVSPFENQHVTNFRLFGDQIDYLTESIPGLEIMGMIKNRTWVNTHGRSG
ncbi:MAG: hypothetical protein HYY20_00370, partial [Candidatus Tectomicrobia bacterium]|nr:hypothetical protein [Candidatus Tectomicrobia bacterium]